MQTPISKIPEIVSKAWGYEIRIWNSEYCGKILHFDKGRTSSTHYHVVKDEVLYALDSDFVITLYDWETGDSNENTLLKGEYLHIYPGLAHRILAPSGGNIVEFSTHHKDSDSRRIRVTCPV